MKTIFIDLIGFEILSDYNLFYEGKNIFVKKGDIIISLKQTNEFGHIDLLTSKGFYIEAKNRNIQNEILYKLANLVIAAAPYGKLKRIYSNN